MFEIRRTPEFVAWFAGLRDMPTRIRLARRLDKASRGLLGDCRPVGSSVSEMRENFGPGWRLYFIQRGSAVVVMLGGGEKSTQANDIAAAITLAATLED